MQQLEQSENLFGVEAVDSCERLGIRSVGPGAPMSENGSPSDSPAHDGGVEESQYVFPPQNNNDTQDMEFGKIPPSESAPSDASSIVALASTTTRLKDFVDHQLDLLMSGAIARLSARTEIIMDRLVSITSFVLSSGSVKQAPRVYTPLSTLFLRKYQLPQSLQSTVPAATDVFRLFCLAGSTDVEIAAILAQYGLAAGVKFKIR